MRPLAIYLLLILAGCDPRALNPLAVATDLRVLDLQAPDAALAPVPHFVEVAAGGYISCGIRDDGRLACWGLAEDRPVEPIAGRYMAVAIDYKQVCALQQNGEIAYWDLEEPPSPGDYEEEPPPPGKYIQIAARLGGCCAIREDGLLRCWGLNTKPHPYYIDPPNIQLTGLSMTGSIGCGLVSDSTARCWGIPTYARVFPSDVPLSVISTGRGVYCGILKDTGEVRCWYLSWPAVDPFPGVKPVQLGSGEYHACMLLEDGTIQCWFDAETLLDPNDPLPVRGYPPATSGFTKISVGPRHGCAIHEQGYIECWGENNHGQLNAPDPDDL